MTSAMKGKVAAFWGAVQKSKARIRQNKQNKKTKRQTDGRAGKKKKILVLSKQIWSSSSSSLERRGGAVSSI